MNGRVSRRSLLLGAGGVIVGGAAASATTLAVAEPRPSVQAQAPGPQPGQLIGPADPRFGAFRSGINHRFTAELDYVKLVTSADDAADALQQAIDRRVPVGVRSGGHCAADFISNKEIRAMFDLSPMNSVAYDEKRKAFCIGAGGRLFNVFDTLQRNWNVTLPGGVCHSVGVGGHVSGGGYGFLSRTHGLVVDHLTAVEVVHVDADRKVGVTVATNDPSDPAHDLWWAHTGGGGGNFGIATRYWFATPGAPGGLVAPPATVLARAIDYHWKDMTRERFMRLMHNYGRWHAEHSSPKDPASAMSTLFNVNSVAHGHISMFIQIDAAVEGARAIVDDFVTGLSAGVTRPQVMDTASGELGAMPRFVETTEMPWAQMLRMIGGPDTIGMNPGARVGLKSAYFRSDFTDVQLDGIYAGLTDRAYGNPDASVILLSFGGAINNLDSEATATAQRDSVMKAIFQTIWADPAEDARHMAWVRKLYQRTFAETEGVPAISGNTDGCYINYPDSDMADPRHNTSPHPWHQLYYKSNYARLQDIKRRWDPHDVFHHSLSIKG